MQAFIINSRSLPPSRTGIFPGFIHHLLMDIFGTLMCFHQIPLGGMPRPFFSRLLLSFGSSFSHLYIGDQNCTYFIRQQLGQDVMTPLKSSALGLARGKLSMNASQLCCNLPPTHAQGFHSPGCYSCTAPAVFLLILGPFSSFSRNSPFADQAQIFEVVPASLHPVS